MRIGILTFHNADNYGAVLQCYALQEKLKNYYTEDNKISIIDYKCPEIENAYIPRFKIFKPWNILWYLKAKRKRRKFQEFREKHLDIGSCDFSQYDVIYYGSDQIWNPKLTNCDLKFWGEGFSGKKIAYAASDGGELVLSEKTKILLNSFSKISCREEILTEKLQNSNISIPIETVCDPVFLLSKDEWLKFAEMPIEENYILAYKISENLKFDAEVEKLGRRLKKKVVQITYVKGWRKYFCTRQKFVDDISPEQFVGYFVKADFVMTTSFHGTAFSIIFNKPFFVMSLTKRSERITNVLSILNIADRYGSEYHENSNEVKGLEEYREKALEFLKTR